MKREELEHIIRASADVTDQYEFIIIGSQSLLGQFPNPESIFTVSMEVDIYPLDAPSLADQIDGAIGEGSPFHETHGYYAQGVGPETASTNRLEATSSSSTKRKYQWTNWLLPRCVGSLFIKGRGWA